MAPSKRWSYLEKTSSINDIESYEKFDFEGSFEFVFSPDHEPSVRERPSIDFAIRNPKDDDDHGNTVAEGKGSEDIYEKYIGTYETENWETIYTYDCECIYCHSHHEETERAHHSRRI